MPRKSAAPVFNHAMIYVRDLAAALHFYADLLGFRVIEQVENAYARLRAGDSTLALHIAGPDQALEACGIRLYFETKDLDRRCAALEDEGVTLKQPPKVMPWGWKHAYLDDPDGHEISLYWAGAKRFRRSPPRPRD